MTALAPGEIAASVSRALWGEVSSKLRSVQFRAVKHRIDLRFFFDGNPNDSDRDSISSIGAEVAADFPGYTISEDAVSTRVDTEIRCQKGWHTAFARRETSMAR